MATDAHVKDLLADELFDRANAKFTEAGDDWSKKDMGFFFPGNENTVDLCALAVLDTVLGEEQIQIPDAGRSHFADVVKTSTKVVDAIKIIALTALKPSPQ
jgi:hypothetical protein